MEETSGSLPLGLLAGGRRAKGADAAELAEMKIRGAVEKSEGLVREMCTHLLLSGGKRLRPRLVLQSGMAFSRANEKMISAAAASELIHMASLAHDDVIDRAALRRGRPSANKLWGNHAAVLCGDWLFAEAFALLSGRGLSRCMGWMVEAIQQMCHGEVLQAGNLGNLDIGEEAYFELISKKTARLTEACCRCGAAAGGAGEDGIEALGGFGLNLGIAFQIADDVLDFRGRPEATGKPAGEDLSRGVITLPVIHLLKDGRHGERARELLAAGGAAERKAVGTLLSESGALDGAGCIAAEYVDRALACLGCLPDSESKRFLAGLAERLR